MKKIFILIFMFLSLACSAFANDTHLLNQDLLDEKIDIENLYYKASSNGKLSKSEIKRLDRYKQIADSQKENKNTNVVPIYYNLGNTYKIIGKDKEAICCYRSIVKFFPGSPLAKKSLVNLKYLGETYTNETGKTLLFPEKNN